MFDQRRKLRNHVTMLLMELLIPDLMVSFVKQQHIALFRSLPPISISCCHLHGFICFVTATEQAHTTKRFRFDIFNASLVNSASIFASAVCLISSS